MTAVHFALGQSKWLTAMRENSPRAIRAHLRTVQAGEGIFALLERRCFPAIPSVQNATRRPPAPTVITGANPVAPATVLGSTKRPSTKATAPTQASPAGATIAAVGNKASYATAAVAAPKAKAKTQVKAKTKVEAETPVKSKTPAKAGTKATKAIKATKATAVVRASAKTPASPSGMTKEKTDFLIERLEAQAGVIRTILPKAERLEQANLELKAENESAAAAVIKAQTAACIAFVAATALAIKAPSRIKRVRSALQATHRAARLHRANVAHKFRLAYQRPAVQHYSVLFSVWMRKGFRAAKFLAKTFLQGVGVGSTLVSSRTSSHLSDDDRVSPGSLLTNRFRLLPQCHTDPALVPRLLLRQADQGEAHPGSGRGR